ncbi:MAG TPA: MdtA/MuxA family multidrug efflux RND transporter periplasmic adaptor subunit [Candidatus Angelobacter sp.]
MFLRGSSCFNLTVRIGVLVLAAAFLAGCGNAPAKQQQQQSSSKGGGRKGGGQGFGSQAVSVSVAKVDTRDLPVYLNGLGSVEAFNTVVVKSRLDGQLVKVAFREGQQVKEGDLLAVIDPRPYEVQLSQAQAMLFKDQAALKDANVNLVRFRDLYQNGGVISKQQLDTQESTVGQLEGAVRADQAQIDNVKLNLTYTRILAPVSGRVGLRLVDVGNMVHAADPNGLLVLTQLHPIAVVFTLPADNLASVAQHMRSGSLQVDAYSRDDQTRLASGKLLTIDNQIDPSTGTGKLKAIFENTEQALWPNQFVNCHLLLETKKNSTVVPAAAIQRGPQGTYVFVMKPDKSVDMRYVTASLTAGNFTAITQGLNPGEVVVTDGQDKLQAGSHVEPRGGAGPGGAKGETGEAAQ